MRFLIWTAAVSVMLSASSLTADPLPVWIDTDPACGLKATDDVDDCYALLLALKSRELNIRGVSTVFGNVPGKFAYTVARDFLDRCAGSLGSPPPPLYRGAHKKLKDDVPSESRAVTAMAEALEKEPLTIVALGPLTNVAALLTTRPDLRPRVRTVIAIAGSSKGHRTFWFENSGLMHFHDLNFLKDPEAFSTVIDTGVPLVLLPFEAAQQVRIVPADLVALARAGEAEAWLAGASNGWMDFWRLKLGEEGFYPFDSLAMGYAIDPDDFTCVPAAGRVTFRYGRIKARDELHLDLNPPGPSHIKYCQGVMPGFHDELMDKLTGE